MKCESCKIEPIEITIPDNEGLETASGMNRTMNPNIGYVNLVQTRLRNFALRPLEYYNLASIYGNRFHLPDDNPSHLT